MSVWHDQFRCCGCGTVWQQTEKPVYDDFGRVVGFSNPASCPKCGGIYAEWLNYRDEKRRPIC